MQVRGEKLVNLPLHPQSLASAGSFHRRTGYRDSVSNIQPLRFTPSVQLARFARDFLLTPALQSSLQAAIYMVLFTTVRKALFAGRRYGNKI